MRDLLRALTAIPGISGHEDLIARGLAEQFAPLADEVSIDPVANVIARFGSGSTRIALCAHIDTVGLMVKRQIAEGTYGVVTVGGANLKALPATAVRLHTDTGDIPGVIGVRSQHQATAGDSVSSADDLYLHTGTSDVEITTPVTYAPQWIDLGGGLVASPALDDRAGCAVLVAIARRLAEQHRQQHTIYLIGTAQEETTCRGAQSALAAIQPDVAIMIDGTVSYDTPETRGKGSVVLGAGVVLVDFLYVSGLNGWHANPQLRARLKAMATTNAIPFQQDAVHGLMSDARVATPLGIPSAILGIPMRGKHSPLEVIHLDDLDSAVSLALAFLSNPLTSLARG